MKIYWLWLSMLKGVGPVTLRRLIDAKGTPHEVYNSTYEELRKIPGIKQSIIDTLVSSRSLEAAKRLAEEMHDWNIDICAYSEPDYPSRLNIDPRLPAIFYYRGILKPGTMSIGIVGSRRCTGYGKQVAAEVAGYLGKQGVTVVSGLAKGIDSYAHTACLKNGGYTLSFVAHGCDICYPSEHQGLMNEIIQNGAIISSFPPGTRPRQEYFPLRNQFLSAWVDRLIVVEASERSGALITAKYAKQYNRPVFAVPNSIYVPESKGSNQLLQNGAIPYLKPEQLIPKNEHDTRNINIGAKIKVTTNIAEKNTLSTNEEWIMSKLENPQMISELQESYPGKHGDFLTTLLQLEISGTIIITGQWVRKA